MMTLVLDIVCQCFYQPVLASVILPSDTQAGVLFNIFVRLIFFCFMKSEVRNAKRAAKHSVCVGV